MYSINNFFCKLHQDSLFKKVLTTWKVTTRDQTRCQYQPFLRWPLLTFKINPWACVPPTNKEKKFSSQYCLPNCLWIFKVFNVKREHKSAYQLWENRESMYYLFKRSRTKRPNSTKAWKRTLHTNNFHFCCWKLWVFGYCLSPTLLTPLLIS